MKPDFDSAVVGEVQRLNLAGQADRVMEFLARFEPRDAEQRFEYECGLGWALQTQGDYRSAVGHMLRALRATARRQDLRVRARHQLAWTFMRSGDFARAERQLRRALDEVHATGVGAWLEPGLLNTLASIHRRRGMLGLTIQTYEQALALPRIGPEARYHGIGVSNLALALMRGGDLARAQGLLNDLLPSLAESVPPGYTAYVHLSRARLALLQSDPDGCEAALEQARQAATSSDYQIGVRLSVQSAELELARGRAAKARTLLEGLLPELLHKAALNDLAPEAARVLAVALFELHRHEEALEKARLAAGLGRHADVLEWAAGLRVAGQCLAALGRREEALAALEEARSVLRGTEFVPEQACLDQTMKALGLGTDAPPAKTAGGAGARRSSERGGVLARLRLQDGRTFVTHDVGLIARIRSAAVDRLPALLVGETGTGKELVAHLIHELSDRAGSAFVVVDCATLPEGLAEAEQPGQLRSRWARRSRHLDGRLPRERVRHGGKPRSAAGVRAQFPSQPVLREEPDGLHPRLRVRRHGAGVHCLQRRGCRLRRDRVSGQLQRPAGRRQDHPGRLADARLARRVLLPARGRRRVHGHDSRHQRGESASRGELDGR